MRVILISNLLTPHQFPLCQSLAKAVGKNNFSFIETISREGIELPEGWNYRGRLPDYVVTYDTFRECVQSYSREILSADIVIFGSAPYELIKKRLAAERVTFLYSERIYKKRCSAWQLPLRAVKYWWKWGRHCSAYLLCASAYTAPDYAMTGTFVGKAYKWGYFPEVKVHDLEILYSKKQENIVPSILWVGRLIACKHPEVSIELAKNLKEKGYAFELNIIGSGEMDEELQSMISQYDLQDCVHKMDSMPPEQVRKHMERADIFLFTSDRNEGWGAVLNESMNSGCSVVANRAIGSVPYLITHGKNGFWYETTSELQEYVELLLQNQALRCKLGGAAYDVLKRLWNADIAAERILVLAEELQKNGVCTVFSEGPCSDASR